MEKEVIKQQGDDIYWSYETRFVSLTPSKALYVTAEIERLV